MQKHASLTDTPNTERKIFFVITSKDGNMHWCINNYKKKKEKVGQTLKDWMVLQVLGKHSTCK